MAGMVYFRQVGTPVHISQWTLVPLQAASNSANCTLLLEKQAITVLGALVEGGDEHTRQVQHYFLTSKIGYWTHHFE